MSISTLSKDAFFTYLNIPIGDLDKTWPADRTIMLRMTSKKVIQVMNNLHLPTVFRFNRIYNIWNNNNSEMCLSAIQHIQSYLRVSKGYITVLDLSKMVIMNKYLQNLVSVIGNCTTCMLAGCTIITLTHLNLSCNSIDNKTIEILVNKLINCQKLSCLQLSDNSIGDKGAVSLARLIIQCSSLTRFDIGYNFIGDEGATALAGGIRQLEALTHLDISFNLLKDQGHTNIAEALNNNTTLTHLDLCHHWISESATKILTESLRHNTSLTHCIIESDSP
jgi:Ran GTPase-activating protein (RanGAP) involved in mRNA processing and transport